MIVVRTIVDHHLDAILSNLHVDLLDEGFGKVVETRRAYHLLVVQKDKVHACRLQVLSLSPN